jgi:adhesin/invasin
MKSKNYKDQYKLYGKRIGVSFLILLTACTNTNQNGNNTNNSLTVINSSDKNTTNDDLDQVNIGKNEYNLPDLGLVPQKEKVKKTIEYDNGQNSYEQKTAQPRNSQSKDFEDLQSMGYGVLNSTASDDLKNWFTSHKITSEISVSAGNDGVRNISFDLLKPLIEDENDLIFTQVGFRRSNRYTEDYRNTINLGLGYRHMYEKILLGANTFYDSDITGHNNRLGLGVEAWADYLKLAANSYLRLSDWKKSVDMYDYMERPANGWDLRVDGYLPQYPQLGAKFMYEQYYGDNVGLFGSSNQQKDPNAATIGLNYTPIPLVTLSTDYRQGQGGQSDTTIKLALNFQLGVPMKKQLSPDEIRSSRLLTNAKYDLVNRNNEIVMDYRKNELGTLTLPATINSSPNSTILFPMAFTGSIRNVSWTGSASQYALPYGGGPTGSVRLPSYNTSGLNTYDLQAIGNDEFGHMVKSNITQIIVSANKLTMASSQSTSIANGSDVVIFTANLKQYTGENIQNADVVWTIQGNAAVIEQENKTDANGVARLKISSKFANPVKVSVKEPSGVEITSDVVFTSDTNTAKVVTMTSTATTLLADGVSFVTIDAVLHDENGNVVPVNTPVTWSTTNGQLSALSTVTDANGHTTVTFKTNIAGNITITANAVKGNKTVTINATPNTSTARVTAISSSVATVVANNTSTSVISATVHDVNGDPVPANTPVGWSTTLGTLSSAITYTDINGNTSVTLKSPTNGSAVVTANASQGSMNTAIDFTVDASTFTPVNLAASIPSATADGIDVISFGVDVQDANGNKAPANTLVSWTTSIGTLGAATSLTDANGHAVMTLTSNMAGPANVVISSGIGSVNTNVTFTAIVSTANVIGITSSITNVLANNTATTVLSATVLDSNNQVVPNATVNWSTTLGNLSNATSVTNASGIAVITLSGTVAGAAIVSAIADAGITRNVNIQFEADPSTANVYSTSLSSSTIIADASTNTPTQYNVYAQLADAYGNPLGAGITVNWSTSGMVTFDINNISQNMSTQTDSNGKAVVPFFVGEVGSHIVVAEYNGISKNIAINAIPMTVQVSTIEGIGGSNFINQDQSATIKIVFDKFIFGNGYIVNINCLNLCQDKNGDNIFTNQTALSNTDMIKFPNITMGQEGTISFTIQVNDGPTQTFYIEVYGPPS